MEFVYVYIYICKYIITTKYYRKWNILHNSSPPIKILINYNGGKYNFKIEKSGRHWHNKVIKVNIAKLF